MTLTPELIVGLASVLVSAIVGLGGLMIAWLTIRANYKERTSSHRQLVYQKQIEACTAMVSHANALLSMTQEVINAVKITHISQDAIDNLKKCLDAQRDEIIKFGDEIADRWVIFVPDILSISADAFLDACQNATELMTNSLKALSQTLATTRSDSLTSYESLSDDVVKPANDAYRNLVIAAKITLGIPSLTKDNLKLMGIDEAKVIESLKTSKPIASL